MGNEGTRTKRRDRKPRPVLWTALMAVGLILLGAASWVAAHETNFLPEGLKFGLFSVLPEDAELLYADSAALVDRTEPVREGQMIGYRNGGVIRLGRVTSLQNGMLLLEGAGGAVQAQASEAVGPVRWQIRILGSVARGLVAAQEIVWAVTIAAVLLFAAWLATWQHRGLRRRARELTILFAKYGEQYALEDQEIDY